MSCSHGVTACPTLPLYWGGPVGSWALQVCFSCSDPIKIRPKTHAGTTVSCCPIVLQHTAWTRAREMGAAVTSSGSLSGAKDVCGPCWEGKSTSCLLHGHLLPHDQLRDFVLSSSEWIPKPARRAGSPLLKPYVLYLVCHLGTSSSRVMLATAQGQSHVCLMRNALLSEAGAGPAYGRGHGVEAWAQRGDPGSPSGQG